MMLKTSNGPQPARHSMQGEVVVNAAPPAEETVIECYQASFDSFNQATSRTGTIDHMIMVGGLPVLLRFAGVSMLTPLLTALSHLITTEEAVPSLTIHIWDKAASGCGLPSLPIEPGTRVVRGHIAGEEGDRIQMAMCTGYQGVSMYDTWSETALFFTPDAKQIPSYETAFPFRFILNWWIRKHNRQLAHCGAVGTDAGAVLLTGKGGSGKSNTTLTCLEAGMLYAGDDYTVLDVEDKPHVHSLYNSAKLEPADAKYFPTLHDAVRFEGTAGIEKSVLFLAQHFPERMFLEAPVRAILLPNVTAGDETSVTPVSGAACLAAMAPGTLFQLPGAGREEFQLMARFARTTPIYRLDLGTDRSTIPGVIRKLLWELQV